MFLDLFPDYLIGLVHDKHAENNFCKEKLTFTEDLIEAAKSADYGLFFTPNGHGRIRNPKGTLYRWDGNVNRLNACFADFDKYSKEQQLIRIRSMPIKPTIIVESKRGYHSYWMLKDTPTNKDTISLWRRVQTTIAEKYDADKACSNPSRLMRLPGSWHVKGEPFAVSVLEMNNESYTLNDMELAFPPPPRRVYMPGSAKGMKMVELPPLTVLHEGDRHPTLKRVSAQMYARSAPSDDFAIRQAIKTWYSLSCVNLKKDWEREVDQVCDWLEKREHLA
jgi:hypothetical protein